MSSWLYGSIMVIDGNCDGVVEYFSSEDELDAYSYGVRKGFSTTRSNGDLKILSRLDIPQLIVDNQPELVQLIEEYLPENPTL